MLFLLKYLTITTMSLNTSQTQWSFHDTDPNCSMKCLKTVPFICCLLHDPHPKMAGNGLILTPEAELFSAILEPGFPYFSQTHDFGGIPNGLKKRSLQKTA